MKKFIIYLFISGLIFSTFSCKNDSGKLQERQIQSELPPSLKENTNEVFLVKLSEKEKNELSIKTEIVVSNFVDYNVTAPGVVFPAPEHSSIISTPINGQVVKINIHEGDWVSKGQEIFRIQSLEYGNLVSEYLQAFAEEKYQSSRLSRLKQLVEESISSASELERATSEFQRASASVKSAYAKLRAVGVPDNEIASFNTSDNFEPTLKIYAPINGIIERNFIELGQSVNALENLSRVLDTRKVLIRGYVSPNDALLIAVGDSVTISKREQQQVAMKSVINSINPGLDETSRSVVINILVSTVNDWPKPGENLRLSVTSETKKEIIAVKLEALTYDGDKAVVFVKKEPEVYERRPIEVEEINDKYVFITSGIKAGEEIAISNVFSLKALSRFDIISEE